MAFGWPLQSFLDGEVNLSLFQFHAQLDDQLSKAYDWQQQDRSLLHPQISIKADSLPNTYT
jgi:hypothetical protein